MYHNSENFSIKLALVYAAMLLVLESVLADDFSKRTGIGSIGKVKWYRYTSSFCYMYACMCVLLMLSNTVHVSEY